MRRASTPRHLATPGLALALALAAGLALVSPCGFAGAGGMLAAQERPDTTATDTSARAATPIGDTLAVVAEGDSAVPDTLREKLIARTPLFPEDVDPYGPLGAAPAIRVVTRDELLAWPEGTLAEVLPRLTPLIVDDQGGPGFYQDVRFPSGEPAATRLTLDGRPLESPLGPAADLRGIPVLAVERIEIHPGTSAIGGAAGWINVVTRTHLTPQPNSGLAFELASFGRDGFGAFLGRWLGRRVSVFGSLQFDDQQTFSEVANADRSRFWLKGRFYLSRTHFAEASYGTSGVTTDLGGGVPALSPLAGREDRAERRLQLFYRGRIGPLTATAAAFTDRFEERDAFTLDPGSLLLGDFQRRGARLGLRADVPGGRAEVGASWTRERVDESDVPPFADVEVGEEEDPAGVREPVRTVSAFAAADLAFGALSLRGRAELFDFTAAAAGASEPGGMLEARWAAPAGFAPFARLSRSARAPSLVERAVVIRSGAEDVLPVGTAREARAGIGWTRDGVEAEISGYAREAVSTELWLPPTVWRAADGTEDVRVGPPAVDQTPFGDLNVIDLQVRGADGRLRLSLPLDLVAEGAASLQSVETEDGAAVPYAPEAVAVGRLGWERRFFPSGNLRVRAEVDGRVVSSRETLSGEELATFALADALLRVQLIGFTFGLDVQNAFDLRYRTEEGFTLPGRIVGFEVTWEFWN